MALNVEQVINEARFNRFHVLLVVLGYLVIIVEGYDLMIYGGTLSAVSYTHLRIRRPWLPWPVLAAGRRGSTTAGET